MSISSIGQNPVSGGFFDTIRTLSPQQARNFLDVAPQISGTGEIPDFTSLSTEASFQLLQPVNPDTQQNFEIAGAYNNLLDSAKNAPAQNVSYDDNGMRQSSFLDENGAGHFVVADPQTGSLSDTMTGGGTKMIQSFNRSGEMLTGYSAENLPAGEGKEEGGYAETVGAAAENVKGFGELGAKLQELLSNPEALREAGAVAGTAEEAGSVAETAFSGLAFAKSASQLYSARQEIREGKTFDGSADYTGGVLNAVGAGAGLIGGAASTVAAPIAFGGAAIADGTKDIVNGIKSGDDEKIGVGSAKDLGGGLLVAGGVIAASGIGAPAGAIVAGVGGAIYLGASLYEHRGEIASALTSGKPLSADDLNAAAWASSLF